MFQPLRFLVAAACLGLATACVGGSGAGVPRISPEKLVTVSFDSVVPRRLTLTITDHRRPLPANSDTMVAAVDEAVRTILQRANITVAAEAPGHLLLDITYPDTSDTKGMKPEDCITMDGTLKLSDGREVGSMAMACWGNKNLYGMRVGNDVNGVYEYVINTNMKTLDGAFVRKSAD